jgi:hypothetical protein
MAKHDYLHRNSSCPKEGAPSVIVKKTVASQSYCLSCNAVGGFREGAGEGRVSVVSSHSLLLRQYLAVNHIDVSENLRQIARGV